MFTGREGTPPHSEGRGEFCLQVVSVDISGMSVVEKKKKGNSGKF